MERLDDVTALVDRIVERVGRRVVVGTPLGLGKANRVLDELYRRAEEDPGFRLEIVTALGLAPPEASSELERRLVGPIGERLFAGYPVPRFERALRADTLPPNVTIRTFFVEPGSVLTGRHAQQHHVSVGYAAAVEVVESCGVNVLAQLVAPGAGLASGGSGRVSLSCNPDLSLDILDWMERRRLAGEAVVACAEANRNLPYMGGDAEVAADAFDLVLDIPGADFALVGPPKRPIDLADHAIGLRAAALVRDGGTLQVGIGALGDAVVWSLLLRHKEPAAWRAAHRALGREAGSGNGAARGDGTAAAGDLAAAIGGDGPFERGLYACSEMLVDGFLDLMDAGVIARRAYDTVEAQLRADAGEPADEGPEAARGHLIHAAFFLGPRGFYERLRALPDAERDLIGMTGVRFTNTLDGDRALKELQRRDARFLNTALQVTLGGAVLSDAVDPGRVVSGVGGQHDFVTMAQALPDGRAVTMVRATRTSGGRPASNIVWDSRHVTIPRHQRDVVVTEYGVADLRGRSQGDVAAALVEVADARFQRQLVAAARGAGILPDDYRVPDHARRNTPEGLAVRLGPHRPVLPSLPFGSDLTPEELALARALRHVAGLASLRAWPAVDLAHARAVAAAPPPTAAPFLARMGLERPRSLRERAWRRLVLYGLSATGALTPDA